jgi:hypothetical protein
MTDALDALVRAFQDTTLPRDQWTHGAHLAVGMWYLSRYSPAETLDRLREDIRTLNRAHGVSNSATSGYHESITRAYVTLLAQWCDAFPHASAAERVETLLASPLAATDVLHNFYSRERLIAVDARARWVEPDLAPLLLNASWVVPGTP